MKIDYSKIDAGCRDLVRALNSIKGIYTVDSCEGHGKHGYWIFFRIGKPSDFEVLPHLLYWFDGCHSGHYGWEVVIYTDCAKSYPTFRVEGPEERSTERSIREAKEIAGLIMKDKEIPRKEV